jgi:hypothetical protein
VRLIRGDDRWLFLTPEIEREVPSLLAELGAGDAAVEQRRIERLIHRGGIDEWFAYLRDCRSRLELATVHDDLRAAAQRLAAVLREQYLLVPALREDERHDAPERRRLEELVWTSH